MRSSTYLFGSTNTIFLSVVGSGLNGQCVVGAIEQGLVAARCLMIGKKTNGSSFFFSSGNVARERSLNDSRTVMMSSIGEFINAILAMYLVIWFLEM